MSEPIDFAEVISMFSTIHADFQGIYARWPIPITRFMGDTGQQNAFKDS